MTIAPIFACKLVAALNIALATGVLIAAGWGLTSTTTPEVIALTTAALVAWNTWKQSRMNKTVDKVHTLTNSAMGKQLLDKVDLLKAMSVLAHAATTPGNDAAKAAADAIDKRVESAIDEYTKHELKQAKVDAS